MRINLFVASLVSLIVGVILFFIYGQNVSVYLGIALAFGILFMTTFVLYNKLSFLKKQPATAISIVLPFISYLAMLFFIIVFVINYPPEGDYIEKLENVVASEEEYENGEKLYDLMIDFGSKFHSLDIQIEEGSEDIDPYIDEFLTSTINERKKISDFVKSKSIAIYARDYLGTGKVWSQEDHDQFMDVAINYVDLELAGVKVLQNQGKGFESAKKYMDLWETVNAIVKVENVNFSHAIMSSFIVARLGEYYYDNQEELRDYNFSRISNITKNILETVDNCFEIIVRADYHAVKQGIDYNVVWPFLDEKKTMRKYHDLFYSMIERLHRPYDESITYEKPLEKIGMFSRNPAGEVQYAIISDQFEKFLFGQIINNYIIRKTEIGVYMYAINYKTDPNDIPKDYKTGDKVRVQEYEDVLEIFTGGDDSRERKFTILKN